MNYRIIIIWGLLIVPDTSPAAELREPITLDGVTSQRIDLDVSKSGSRKSVLIRTSFVEDERTRCPEDSGQLQISHGTLAQIRMALLSDPDGQGSSLAKHSFSMICRRRVSRPGAITGLTGRV
jgi:hypothetical protein